MLAADGVAEAAGGEPADALAVPHDGLPAPELDLGVVGDGEGHEAAGQRLLALPPHGVLSDEGRRLVERDSEAETRFQRIEVGADVRRPDAVALLQPQAVDRPVARIAQAVFGACRLQRVVDRDHVVGGDVQLPTQLADEGDAHGADGRAGNVDLPHRAEGKGIRSEIAFRHGGRNLAGARPHQPEHAVSRGHVDQRGVGVRVDVTADVVEVVGRKARAGDDVEGVFGDPRDGQVALDPAMAVEHLRVGDPPRRLADVGRADALQAGLRIAPDQGELGEGRLVEEGGRVPAGRVLDRHVRVPVGAPEAVDLHRLDPFGREPVGALPPELGAETGAVRREPVVDRAAPERPAGLHLLARPDDGVVMALALQRASQNLAVGPVIGAEAADIEAPDVVGRLAVQDPLAERHAGAAAAGEPVGVEARAHEDALHLRRLAHHRVLVLGEGFQAVEPALDAGGLQHGNPVEQPFQAAA